MCGEWQTCLASVSNYPRFYGTAAAAAAASVAATAVTAAAAGLGVALHRRCWSSG